MEKSLSSLRNDKKKTTSLMYEKSDESALSGRRKKTKILSDLDAALAETKKNQRFPELLACIPMKQRQQMRKDVITHTKFFNERELRREKLAVYKCLFFELEEDGLRDAADYLKELIRENDEIIAQDDIGMAVDLKKMVYFLEVITAGLRKASIAHSKKNIIKESTAFLELALFFGKEERGVLWIAEKFFLIASALASLTKLEGGKQEAQCRYAHGRFLLDRFPSADMSEAEEVLVKARRLANGRGWVLEKFIIINEKIIGVFESASVLLHKILLCRARNFRTVDPFYSERLCCVAKRRGIDSGNQRLTAAALIEMGCAQEANSDILSALKSYQEALETLIQCKYVIGICEAYMYVASGLLRVGEDENAVNALTTMGSLAVECGLQKQLGRALHLLGELYLTRSRPRLASVHFAEAFNCFLGAVDFLVKEEEEKFMRCKDSMYQFSGDKRKSKSDVAIEKIEEYIELEDEETDKQEDVAVEKISDEEEQVIADTLLPSKLEVIDENVGEQIVEEESESSEESIKEKPIYPVAKEDEIPGDSMISVGGIQFDKNEIIVETSSLDSDVVIEDLYVEAEQSRFLNAVASGQHRIKSYFEMLIKSKNCNIDAAKVMDWKLNNVPWNSFREEDRQMPCHCPRHNRTALDIVLENIKKREKKASTESVLYGRKLPRG